MMNRNALFSDETVDYKAPYQPKTNDAVSIRIRTLKDDVSNVHAVVNGEACGMKKIRTDEQFDYYEYCFVCGDSKVNYCFELENEEEKVFFNRLGAVEERDEAYDFSFMPGFSVPEWALGTVYYQIFTDRFFNGTPDNDVQDNEYYYAERHVRRINDWNRSPAAFDVANFYGGDLQGVRRKLDYLKDLGVETIYFNPLFVSPSNHKYDTQDYDYIDPHLAVIEEDIDHKMEDWEKHNGYAEQYIKRTTSKVNLEKSNQYFSELVKEIHEKNMRVVIDGVFNHCGSFGKWMDREGIYLNKDGYELGAYQAEDSKYRHYFNFDAPSGKTYEGWWGYNTLPKLNYEACDALVENVLSIGKKWVSEPYSADGWRLDVAADLGHSKEYNHLFWKKFRKAVRGANPEAVILAEHYGDASEWLNGSEWDTVMNYDAFMDPVTWFLTGMEKHSDAFDEAKLLDGEAFFAVMREKMAAFSRPSLDAALNQLSNHDHSRFLTRTNRRVGRLETVGAEAAMDDIDIPIMKLGVLIQMTWPGAPGIYYGDEAGQVGWTDPDSRRTYPWGHENTEILDFYKESIRLRNTVKCLRMGSIKPLSMGKGYIAYARFDQSGCAVIAVNAGKQTLDISVPVWEAGVCPDGRMNRILSTVEKAFFDPADVHNGMLRLSLSPRSGCVYADEFPFGNTL